MSAASKPAGEPLLSCEGLEVSYGQVQVLFGVDLAVAAGEIVALLGTNGAGKSTLLRATVGLTPPRRGRVRLEGSDVTGADPTEMARRGVVMMPGGRAVFPGLSVRENLEMAAWLYRDRRAEVAAAVDEALELFPPLRSRLAERAALLSGGQQQMVALAQTLVARPQVLLLDELSLGLAPVVVAELLDVVRRLRDRGLAVVLVEQSVNVALGVADRAVFMEKGTVRYSGNAAQLSRRDDLLRSVFIGRVDVGAGERPDSAPPAGDVVLAGRALTRRFGGLTAVDAVDVAVRAGEIVGIIGPNGAGKTTLLDLLAGSGTPDAGRVELDGRDVTGLPPHRRAALGLARSFQGAGLFPNLTVAESILVALDDTAPNRDPLAAALHLPVAIAAELLLSSTAERLVDALGLGAFRDKRISELSTGSRRVVELAMIVARRARVVLLDEPSAGLAQRETEALGPLLRRLRDLTGAAILIVEHDVPLLQSVCDRLVAMDLGAVVVSGSPAEVVRDPRVVESYLGASDAAVRRSGAPTARRRPARRAAPPAPDVLTARPARHEA